MVNGGESGPRRWQNLTLRRKRLRLAGFDYADSSAVFFITLRAQPMTSPFEDTSLAWKIVETIEFFDQRGAWRAYVFCLMPDHLHLAVSPLRQRIDGLMQGFKSFTTRLAWQQGVHGKLWQRSYYDHIARREEDLMTICEYILGNPVRSGLVDEPDRWPLSGTVSPLPW